VRGRERGGLPLFDRENKGGSNDKQKKKEKKNTYSNSIPVAEEGKERRELYTSPVDIRSRGLQQGSSRRKEDVSYSGKSRRGLEWGE